MPKKSGFTLVELLIVLTIMSLLFTIGIVSYIDFNKRGRDTKRQSDLNGIQSALSQFYVDQVYYPSLAGSCGSGTFKFDCPLKSTDTFKTYLNKLPKDPLTSPTAPYCYVPLNSSGGACDNSPANKCTAYELYAVLEKPPSSPPSYNIAGCGIYNFKLTPP